MQSSRSYLICGTPRAGTGLLSGLLASTGLAGDPQELFWNQSTLETEWGVSRFDEFVAEMRRRATTENGIFGTTVMWGYFEDVLARLRTLSSASDEMGEDELLELAFPGLRYVFIRREDVVAQAVSHVRAIQDGIWYAGETAEPKPTRFDFEAIDSISQENRRHNAMWRAWFARHGVEPFEVAYEDLVQAPREITLRLLGWLGAQPPQDIRVQARWPKQADAVNAEWVRRYRSMVRGRCSPSAEPG